MVSESDSYRYNVFRADDPTQLVGRMEGDGFVRSPENKILYRVNREGFSTKLGKMVGFTRDAGRDGATIVDEHGKALFSVIRV
ncbi:hypothetical protein [Pseudomonas sp. SDI]|uniref:hypothetical protein n=1 Tax=Pseudomonas sp. SDI TaxID=2170734 RepID=UPI001057B05A|nr:hypothetical protein [Pseudomonas sp. SDI]